MTAKIFTGRDAQMYIRENNQDIPVAKVTAYSFQSDLELLEATSLNNDVKEFVPGIQSYSGNVSLIYYKNDQNSIIANKFLSKYFKSDGSGITAITDAFNLLFVLSDGTFEASRRIRFQYAYITSISLGASVGEVASMQMSFQATGGALQANIN